jgi:hypothetical protein
MVKLRGEWLILSFLLSISSAKMISDFKVKNRSPPLKKKYQHLGIYQMHYEVEVLDSPFHPPEEILALISLDLFNLARSLLFMVHRW